MKSWADRQDTLVFKGPRSPFHQGVAWWLVNKYLKIIDSFSSQRVGRIFRHEAPRERGKTVSPQTRFENIRFPAT
jgi:hypothetical protein